MKNNINNLQCSFYFFLDDTHEKEPKCSICDKIFPSRSHRRKHEVRVHKLEAQERKSRCSIVCDRCPMSFTTIAALRAHLSKNHDFQNEPIIHEFESNDGK